VPHSVDPPFDFTRLGVRVPAVFVSPCIRPNTVLNNRDYEHSSVVATVRELFCPGSQPFNWREAQANKFDDVLVLEGADVRNDPVPLPDPVVGDVATIQAAAEVRTPTDLSVLIARAMQYSLEALGIAPPPQDINDLNNAAAVCAYSDDAWRRLAAGGAG
jgi:phospholipase C